MKKIRPYLQLMRLDKPVGILLLYWPCVWAILLASPAINLETLTLLLLFFIGAVVMRSAGCVINDLFDRDIDKKVTRTKTRPLASGQITKRQALMLLAALLNIGLGILLMLNLPTIVAGVGYMVLVVCYPLAKRVMRHPQWILGLTFGAGAVMGWLAVRGEVTADSSIAMGALYLMTILWIYIYDTVYAFQDREDDLRIGIGSSAVALGDKAPRKLLKYTALMGICWVLISAEQGLPIWVDGGFLLALIWLVWQILCWNQKDVAQSRQLFSQQQFWGAWVAVILLLAQI